MHWKQFVFLVIDLSCRKAMLSVYAVIGWGRRFEMLRDGHDWIVSIECSASVTWKESTQREDRVYKLLYIKRWASCGRRRQW